MSRHLFRNRRSRKRRSNRRKTAQQTMLNVCNAGLAPLNEVAPNFDVLPNSSYVVNQNAATDNAAINLNKKRKFSSQDVPGPSSYHTKGSPKEAPMTEFYHSLLESSYHDNFNCTYTSNVKEKLFDINFAQINPVVPRLLMLLRRPIAGLLLLTIQSNLPSF